MGKHEKHHHHDVEAGYPPEHGGYMIETPELRWAFIRKVYVIVSLQMLVTVAVAGAMYLTDPVRSFFLSRTPAAVAAFIVILISPLLGTHITSFTMTINGAFSLFSPLMLNYVQ